MPTIFASMVGLFLFVSCLLYISIPSHAYLDLRNDNHLNSSTDQTRSLRKSTESRKRSTIGKVTQRELFEKDHDPSDLVRLRQIVQERLRDDSLIKTGYPKGLPYDIYNCPEVPSSEYPVNFPILDVLHTWNPDNTTVPETIFQSLCIFDWEKDQAKAEAYREAEVPFVLQNYPELLRASERWTTPGYLPRLLGDSRQRNEYSANNHMMFWRLKSKDKKPAGWEPPTENVELSYEEWLAKAEELESIPSGKTTDSEHWYFRLNGLYGHSNSYLFDELPFFKPTESTMFMVDPEEARGINCRFGQRGIIAENHYDTARNWITIMGGKRRYILAHPDQCKNMELFPLNHPSGRHSKIDWSQPPSKSENPTFAAARVFEIVLQAGDALYLPTFYFHFIVSLNLNFQCNARSGMTVENANYIENCGL